MSAEWVRSRVPCVCVCVWGRGKLWELHLLCKCRPLIDCRARSLSFSGWTLPSTGSRGSCQGSVWPLTHTCVHAPSSLPLSVVAVLEQAWHMARERTGTARGSTTTLSFCNAALSSQLFFCLWRIHNSRTKRLFPSKETLSNFSRSHLTGVSYRNNAVRMKHPWEEIDV